MHWVVAGGSDCRAFCSQSVGCSCVRACTYKRERWAWNPARDWVVFVASIWSLVLSSEGSKDYATNWIT